VTPKVYPDKEGEPVHFYPGPAGAKEWTHAVYSPKTGLFYVPVQDVGATATRRRREFKESIPYWGAGVQVDIEDMTGSISAFDANGEEKWRWRNELPMCASVLAPTRSTDGSTSPYPSGGARGPRGSYPACSAPATEAR
jgi:alcohol dehydrogenase (cytochrome c)